MCRKSSEKFEPAAVVVPVKSFDRESNVEYLLPPQKPKDIGKKTLVLDLDETLIHSVFKPVEDADIIIKIPDEVMDHEGNKYALTNDIFVFKRPGVDMFLKRLSRYYELVIFTASIDKYANPVVDSLDKNRL
jgi:RNA polymerase II subunit A small phosphatase-like protein